MNTIENTYVKALYNNQYNGRVHVNVVVRTILIATSFWFQGFKINISTFYSLHGICYALQKEEQGDPVRSTFSQKYSCKTSRTGKA